MTKPGLDTISRELVSVLRERLDGRLFKDAPTVIGSGEAYHEALANSGGIGMACFATQEERERLSSAARAREAFAARAYVYALETLLLQLCVAMTEAKNFRCAATVPLMEGNRDGT